MFLPIKYEVWQQVSHMAIVCSIRTHVAVMLAVFTRKTHTEWMIFVTDCINPGLLTCHCAC